MWLDWKVWNLGYGTLFDRSLSYAEMRDVIHII
jgi:hypothetical protein